ncbi:MAG: hypothetical protein ACO1OO_05375 [Flavisolibacter sp.]
MKKYIGFSVLLLAAISAGAQDSTGRQVKITSVFQPVLKEAAKMNFNASPAAVDTSTPRLQYNIPNQNLNFALQPGTLKPLALQVDTAGNWPNESYVKLGFGNLSTPFGQVGLSVGDGKTAGLNVYGQHVSSKGKLPYQDYSHTNIDLNAFFQSGGNQEWNARFGAVQDKHNRYGFDTATVVIPEDSLRVKLQTWSGRVSVHNINRTELGISYAPELRVDAFSDQNSNSESNTYINLPLQKTIGEEFAADLGVTTSLSRFKPDNKGDVSNNFITISPAVIYKASNLYLKAGIRPGWDNSSFKLFPNIMAEFSSTDERFSFQAGWSGNFRNSGYQYMAGVNPYILAPDSVYNSGIEERYAGFKGSAGDHFTYSVRAAYNKITNQPLFTNDTSAAGNAFMVINEPVLKVLNFGGELGFNIGEKFSLLTNLQFNQYKPEQNEKAWGLLPLEFRTNMRLQVMKDLYVTGDLFAFDGPWYMLKGGGKESLQGGMDLSGGVEYKVHNNVRLWAQFNNILNKEYQRWNQYPVYGFNFLGGVVISFAQNR